MQQAILRNRAVKDGCDAESEEVGEDSFTGLSPMMQELESKRPDSHATSGPEIAYRLEAGEWVRGEFTQFARTFLESTLDFQSSRLL